MLGKLGIDLVFVDGVLALFEQIGVTQGRLFAGAELRAAGVIEQVANHAFGQSFGFGDIGADGRAITALVCDRDLDPAHFLELVRQDAPIEQLVSIFDPGNAELASCHQADDTRIGRLSAWLTR